MDIRMIVIYVIFALIAFVLLINIFKVFLNVLRGDSVVKKEVPEDPIVAEIRSEVNAKVRPHLKSLEGMYEKSAQEEKSLASFVFSVVKDKFSSHIENNEKTVESEIDKCCSNYENAECKESFCLEGSGISCGKV